MEDYLLVGRYSQIMEHSKWQKEIPYIQFPTDWQVQISPPFAGAVVRFIVKKDKAEVSIYLDCYDNLGCYDAPYWEVYPHNAELYRCDMSDTENLLNAIKLSIIEQNSSSENE